MKIYVTIEFIGEKASTISFPDFYPKEAKTPWNDIEIHPIIEIEKGICEVIQDGKESFWSVYLHQLDGGLKCIADVESKIEAESLAELIHQCSNTRIHSSNNSS